MKDFRSIKEPAFVTLARVEQVGAHERFSLWLEHAFVGTLTLGLGQGSVLAGLLGLAEHVPIPSEPPAAGILPLEWGQRASTAPFGELAIAVQRVEIEKATWIWRCAHGNALRDHLGTYEPECGCRARTRSSDA